MYSVQCHRSQLSGAMKKIVEAQKAKSATFRPFTAESLEKIKQRVDAEKQRAAEEAAQRSDEEGSGTKTATRRPTAAAATTADRKKKRPATTTREHPNPALETGKKLPDKLGEFPSELYGHPIEDLDDFYNNKFVSRSLP